MQVDKGSKKKGLVQLKLVQSGNGFGKRVLGSAKTSSVR